MEQHSAVTILIADDHPVFRKGLYDLIGGERHLSVVGETGDGNDAKRLVLELKPDVLLLDLNMPGVNGLDIASWARDNDLAVKVIVLTMHKEEAVFNKAMDLGVRGYVLKESAVKDILDSIKTVMEDGYYISPAISQYLVHRKAGAESVFLGKPGLQHLTASERKILKLIADNKTSKEIADILFISTRTVENHRMNICNKLNLHGSNGLLRFALDNKSFL